jgi:hypothetical protein
MRCRIRRIRVEEEAVVVVVVAAAVRVVAEVRGKGKDSHHRQGQANLREEHLPTAGRNSRRRHSRLLSRHPTPRNTALRG